MTQTIMKKVKKQPRLRPHHHRPRAHPAQQPHQTLRLHQARPRQPTTTPIIARRDETKPKTTTKNANRPASTPRTIQ